MLDNKTRNILALNDIKEVMVEVMVKNYAEKEVSKSTLNKFKRFMAEKTKTNTSRNSVDSRIESLYKAIQKQYDIFIKLNAILTELD